MGPWFKRTASTWRYAQLSTWQRCPFASPASRTWHECHVAAARSFRPVLGRYSLPPWCGSGEEAGVAQPAERPSRGVVLPTGHTGSSLFHALLTQATAEFPGALRSVNLPPRPGPFKRDYGDIL